jgi:hypothetical protein
MVKSSATVSKNVPTMTGSPAGEWPWPQEDVAVVARTAQIQTVDSHPHRHASSAPRCNLSLSVNLEKNHILYELDLFFLKQ